VYSPPLLHHPANYVDDRIMSGEQVVYIVNTENETTAGSTNFIYFILHGAEFFYRT
jgi:hypothetical protein